jgi:hypothetical protein
MEYYIYTANVGTILISSEKSSRRKNGLNLINIHDAVLIKRNSSIVRQYFGKCNRFVSYDLNCSKIKEKDFLNAFHNTLEMMELQEKNIKIRDNN